MKKCIAFIALSSLGLQLQAQVSFTLTQTVGVGAHPIWIAAADVNGDGKPDVITANRDGNSLSVLTNNGSGGFVTSGTYAVGSGPSSVTVADVNGDGQLDLISANYYNNTLSVLTNNGSGGFVMAATLNVGSYPHSVTSADVNGDGKVDLICENYGDSTLSVLTNNGSGGFVTSGTYAVGTGPECLTAADVNGDGKVDLISANWNAGTLSVLTNDGSGGFVTSGNYAVGNDPLCLTAADVNGDGKPDLICANWADNTLSVLTNNGSGGFVTSGTYAVGHGPHGVTAADLTGDGSLDLICANYDDSTLSVLTNNGSGQFATAAVIAVGSAPYLAVAVDVIGDGKMDLISVNEFSYSVSVFLNTSILPEITSEPASATNNLGDNVSLTVGATGANPLDFHWYFSGTNIDTGSNSSLNLANISQPFFGNYYVVVANAYGSITSSLATIYEPPTIISQPTSQDVALGSSASFVIAADGTQPLSYQWYFNGTNALAGATTAALTLTNIQLSQAGSYAVLVSNGGGATNSVSATLTVELPPVITQQPQSQIVLSYNSAAFTIAATGTGPLTYQWQLNGINLVDNGNVTGSATTNLTLASVSVSDAGNYDVLVSSSYGTTSSATAVLTVPETAVSMIATNAMSGGTLIMPILMNALGVENTFLASVAYDPTKLAVNHVQLGQATALAYLQEIDTQTNNGFVGFAILLNYGLTIPAGPQEVAEVVFQALPVTNNTTVNLTFGDTPTARQVVDNNLNLLPAIYQGGSILLTPAEYAADVYPRFNGDHQLTLQDWLEEGRLVAGLDTPTNADEFLRADCAPRNAPDGVLTVADWVQAGRYALGLDPITLVTPPATPHFIAKGKPEGDPTPTRILQIANVSAQRGQSVTVPVQLVCTTNENAVGMTVSYSPNQLRFVNVSLGSALTGGRLIINSNQLAGKVGLALALSPGATLAAGTNQVALLQFVAGTNTSGTVALALDNSVVKLEVADLLANSLAAAYVNGSVTLPGQPTVTASANGGNLQLSWPVASGTFQVQTADSPSGPWTTVVLPTFTNGANAVVTVSATNQQQYFRLQGQ